MLYSPYNVRCTLLSWPINPVILANQSYVYIYYCIHEGDEGSTGYLSVVSLKVKKLWLKVHSTPKLNRGKWSGWIISVGSGIYSFSGRESG
jgi:hypothetical protein